MREVEDLFNDVTVIAATASMACELSALAPDDAKALAKKALTAGIEVLKELKIAQNKCRTKEQTDAIESNS